MSAVNNNNKFSQRVASKVHQLKKILKPVMKLLHSSKKSRKWAVDSNTTPATPAEFQSKQESYIIAEDDQNAANEAVESRLRDDIRRSCTEDGGSVGIWIDGHVTLFEGHSLEDIPIPVKFAYTPAGDFFWAPLPDSDICLGRLHTRGLKPEKQVPIISKHRAR